MKTILKFALCLSALCSFVGCDKEDDTQITALAINGIKAEALPGAIQLTWNILENRQFLYAKVSYYDWGSEKIVTKLCSRYTDSLYVDNLLNRYGNYKFTFTVFDIDGNPGQPVYIERQCQKAASYYVISDEVEIPLSAEQLGTNAQEPSEGPIANIVDNNLDTFFQSFWDEWNYPELKPTSYHYLTFDLKQEVSSFKFQYWNRKKGGSLPSTVNIYGSSNGEEWTLLGQLTNLPTENGSTYTSELFLTDAPVSHIKYEMVKGSDAYQPYFSLAEIKFYEVIRTLVDPEAE